MKWHVKPLLFSIIIHSIFFGIFAFVYFWNFHVIPSSQEKKVCIHLACIKNELPKPSQTLQHKKMLEKKEVQRKKKTHQKTHIEEKKIQKRKKILKKAKPKHQIKKQNTGVQQPSKVKQEKKNIQSLKKKVKPQKHKEVEKKQVKKGELQRVEDMQKNEYSLKQTAVVTQQIARLIRENLYYPRRARKRGIEGEVLVEFRLLKDGTIQNIHILQSPSSILSRATKKTLEELSHELPKPQQKLIIKLPVVYKLSN